MRQRVSYKLSKSGNKSSRVSVLPFLSVKKLSGRPTRGSELGFRGWEGEEELARVPEEFAKGVPSGEGAEDLAQGDGGRPEGPEPVGGEATTFEEAVVARVRCR